MGNTAVKTNISENIEEKKTDGEKKLKPCCACPETKRARDACIIEKGEENCGHFIEAHKELFAEEGEFLVMDSQNCDERKHSTSDTEEQEIKAHLREKFLRFIAKISNGEQAEIFMHENTVVSCKIRGFDKNVENIVVEDLKTPYLPVAKAILRSSDIISIKLLKSSAELLVD